MRLFQFSFTILLKQRWSVLLGSSRLYHVFSVLWLTVRLSSSIHVESSVSSTNYTLATTEVLALQSLYLSTNGSQWAWRNTTEYGRIWNFSDPLTNPCDHWQGVTCNSTCTAVSGCHVVSLALPSYRLMGSIPSSISDLSRLKTLDLMGNVLTGTFPRAVSTMTSLETLNLGSNTLMGTLPTSASWTGL